MRLSPVVLALLAAACQSPAPPAEGEGEGQPAIDAGTTVDAGGGSDAGGQDAGQPDDAGPPPPDDAGQNDAGATSGPGPYDVEGPETVTTFDVSVATDVGHFFTVHVFLPDTAGPRPVVSLSPGLLQNANAYDVYAQRLASHGIAAISRDDPGAFTATTDVTADILYLVNTWLPAEAADSASPLFGRVDLARVGLAGHSRGGKASLIAAEAGSGIAWFGLDPVDAAEFSGGAQARDQLGDLHIPTAFMGASVSTSCSPAADNYEVLFAGIPSPSVAFTAIHAGHTELESADQCVLCGGCTPAGTADQPTVLAYSVRYLTAFFARELLDDSSVGATFNGAGADDDIVAGLVSREVK